MKLKMNRLITLLTVLVLFAVANEVESRLRPMAEAQFAKWVSIFTPSQSEPAVQSNNPYLQKVSVVTKIASVVSDS